MALALSLAAVAAEPPPEGVSEALARERAAAITDLAYDLALTIPADSRTPVSGRVVVRFSLAGPRRLVFDFAQPLDRLRSVRALGREVRVERAQDHVIVAAADTVRGRNEIEFAFQAGDAALNRSDEFLYSLFVPARAHLAFPCFDQPDLKARFRLSLTAPEAWEVVSNGAARAVSREGGRATTTFEQTPPLPTYLFAFAAGRFAVEHAVRDGRAMRMLHRETDAAKVARNRDAVFDLHASALAWLERYTGVPYPFGKFDFVLIPSFQFGGMEHAGAVLYNAAGILLDESATQNQLLGRASLIAHESAHMWFGDLVTMRWFNDVWMKEVFANFMAAKIVNPAFPALNHDLRFLLSHYPAAYRVDRTDGTNAIRQPLWNLRDAGQMYGAIIYEKAPIVMRQLELAVGETAFRDGLREYLRRFAFGNATWPDLVRVLDARSPRDVAAWSRAWVDQRGRPAIDTGVQVDARGRLAGVVLTQRDPLGRGVRWPQELEVALGYPDGIRHLPASMTGRSLRLRTPSGLGRPLFVLGNGRGLGYGLFLLDDASRAYLLAHIEDVPDALTRGSAWLTLWDNLLEGRVEPAAWFEAAARALPVETDEQNAQRVLGYLTRAFWQWTPPAERPARAARLEPVLRAGVARGRTQGEKAAWFNAYRDIVISPEGTAWLERLWRRDETIPGLTFAEPDEITMALELAVREVPRWSDILAAQIARTENADRRARLIFVAPALSADPEARERAFARFQDVEQRRREAWVLESVQYLNHPLRAAHAERFVRPALELLQEIQRTGDIFFPGRWMEATLGGHRSAAVAGAVRQFLAERTAYPERLRWTVLTAADELFRTSAR